MDHAATWALSEGVTSTICNRWGLAGATMAKATTFSPLPLMEIHAIGAAQLAECTRWRRSNSSPNPPRQRRLRHHWPACPRKLHYGSKAHTVRPQCDSRTTRYSHNLNCTCETHAMVSPVNGGGPATTPRCRWHRFLKAACTEGHCCDPSKHRPMPSGIPPWNSASSPLITLSAPWGPNFAQSWAAIEVRHSMSPPRMRRRVPVAVGRGANKIARRPQLITTAASTSEQMALA
jgi:hypothetical protein